MTSKLQLSLFRSNDTCVSHNGLVFALILRTTEKQTQIVAAFQFSFLEFIKKGWYGITAASRCKARAVLERSNAGVSSSDPTRYTRGSLCCVSMGRRLPSIALQVVNEMSKILQL